MILPIGDDQIENGHTPIVSYSLLVLNALVFFYEISVGDLQLQEFVTAYGTSADQVLRKGHYLTILSSMFLHGGWMHFLGNMVFLWVFADNIEAIIGNWRFLLFYLFGGLMATILQIGIDTSSAVPLIGASGAIAAVMGAYLVMFPHSKIRLLIIIFFSTFRIPAWVFLIFWILQQFVYGLGSLSPQSGEGGGVAWWAHIGGILTGVLCGIFFKRWFLGVERV